MVRTPIPAETVGSILRGFLIGLVGIYIVLSFQFRSYIEPVIVMFTIPLALIGVVLGHLIMGYNISMPSIMGAASLAGIVVNNAILLIQVIQRHVQEGVRTQPKPPDGPAANAFAPSWSPCRQP